MQERIRSPKDIPFAKSRKLKRHRFDSWVGKTPEGRKWQPAPIVLPGKSYRQSCLAGYSPWGHKVRHNWVSDWAYILLRKYKEKIPREAILYLFGNINQPDLSDPSRLVATIFFKSIYLFIWLHWIFLAADRIFTASRGFFHCNTQIL